MGKKYNIKNRIEKLRKEIARQRELYHVKDSPGVTDEVYDSLNKELKHLLEEYPEYNDLNAPEHRVAGRALDKFKKVKHEVLMRSIGNVFSKEELLNWEKRNLKLLPLGMKLYYFCELKLDGLAVSLIYEEGKFVRGVTRGDGETGEDITENLKMIKTIPLVLRKPYPKKIEVRGEAIMKKDVLIKLNKENEKNGLPAFANSRNAAAGSLRQLDPKLAAKRHLDFFAYEIAQIEGKELQKYEVKHSLKHDLLKRLGFVVDQHSKKISSLENAMDFISEVAKIRDNLTFGIDGVVINIDDTKIFGDLGVAGKDPRGIIAFKYPAERVTTLLEDIKVNVGRTGVLTPLAVLKPVVVAGSTVSKATLHNMDQIERLDLRIGDTVVLEKAGDVIPKILEALTKLRSGKEKKFKMPEKCPVCGTTVKKKLGSEKLSVGYYCPNPKCPAKNERYLEHFVSIFEIYELGPKILRRFKDEGLISDASDIFTLEKEDIEMLSRFGEKSAENIIEEIKNKKKITLAKFLWALGILHVGEETARDLANNFGTLEKLEKANMEGINQIENIGPAVSKSLYDFFRDKNNLNFIKKLQTNGVIIEKSKNIKEGKFKGMTFVLTGTLPTMSREEAKEKIIQLSGKISSSVSKNTSYVLVGAEPGSKLKEAQKLGVKILNEQEFLDMIK